MDMPTHAPREIRRNERLSSHQLFGTLRDLDSETEQTDNVLVETIFDKNTSVLSHSASPIEPVVNSNFFNDIITCAGIHCITLT